MLFRSPEIKEIVTDKGTVTYLNSGDWVENLTALEYHRGVWSIYQYQPEDAISFDEADALDNENLDDKLNVNKLLELLKTGN